MKIDICLTATNMKSIYLSQIPVFIKVWSLLGIEPKIILINSYIPEEYKEYENSIILFDRDIHNLKELNTAYIAQTIRIFYPALFPSHKKIIISDIDIVPISHNFFVDSIKEFSDRSFINYRRYNGQLNICYNVARADIWKEIFAINNIEDISKRLLLNYNIGYNSIKNCPGWFTDQEILTDMVLKYQKKMMCPVIFLDKLGYKINRLDKRDKKMILANKDEVIKNIGNYTDFHITSKNEKFIKLSNTIIDGIIMFSTSQAS